ncbi:hypothetical protein OXYTRIMIC_134 [Oxytricha trifallax]|uniref:Uncharacterized protein n=1 Tax=Oxytricha trifallax TaxID=1172189 RepID=A0A073I0H2_9SPIT|nr:hypothetical protein OXYTRIMIC_134 [Oxytricha trifallax]
MKYMNFYEDYQEVPDRKYFYGVLGTLWPGYVQELIKHANKVRNIKDKDEEANEMIYITDDIFKKLESEPFFSKTKGKALSMLKYRSKPRAKKIKRQFHEISQPFKEFKSKVEDYGEGDRQIIPKEMIQDSSGKRAPPDIEME